MKDEKEQLLELKKEIKRGLYLRRLATGEIQGAPLGYPSVDRPWLKYYDPQFLKQDIPQMNIYDYMKEKTKGYDDKVALTYFNREITYKELHENIDTASKVLTHIGVKNNDRIMYLLPNIPETAYLLYGGSQIGAVSDYVDPRPDSVDPRISAKKILSLFKEEKAKFIIALDQCYLAMLKPIEKELKEEGLESIVLISASDSMKFSTKLNYLSENAKFNGLKNLKEQLKKTKAISKMIEDAKKSSSIELLDYKDLQSKCKDVTYKKVEYETDKLNVIVHTSGTSSPKPKPIPLTNDNLNAYTHQTFGANMPMQPGDKALHILPYFAAFGLVDVAHALLCHGNNLIEIPEFTPSNIGKILMKYKPQTLIGPPTWILSLDNDPVLKNADLSFLRMLTYGGDAMEEADEERINKFLKRHNASCILTKGHGMSEVCGCASYATGAYNEANTMGIPMPNTVYGVVDPETKELVRFKAGEDTVEGELIILSKAVTSGVLDDNVIVKHATYNGEDYIYTGDIASISKDGVMRFFSRSDRSFTRYDGFKVKPYEIEGVIKEAVGVKYCVVSPYVEEDKFGNMPVAHIVLEDNMVLSDEEKILYVKNLINKHFINNPNVSTRQIPSKFRFRDSIPVTGNGKMDFNAIAAEGLDGSEITVELEETNISVGDIKIYGPDKNKIFVNKKRNS